jgi:hypothetical protein
MPRTGPFVASSVIALISSYEGVLIYVSPRWDMTGD